MTPQSWWSVAEAMVDTHDACHSWLVRHTGLQQTILLAYLSARHKRHTNQADRGTVLATWTREASANSHFAVFIPQIWRQCRRYAYGVLATDSFSIFFGACAENVNISTCGQKSDIMEDVIAYVRHSWLQPPPYPPVGGSLTYAWGLMLCDLPLLLVNRPKKNVHIFS